MNQPYNLQKLVHNYWYSMMVEQKYVSNKQWMLSAADKGWYCVMCNVWLPGVMMQRLQATAMEKSQTFQSSYREQNISRRKYCDLSLDRSVFSLVTLEGWFYLNSYFLIFRNRNILKLWEVSLSQLLDWTEDCWSLAQARWGRQPRSLIGQYWGNTGLSLVESLQPGPVKLHQQQCAMKLGNFVVNYIKSTFKIVPAK